MRPWIHYLRRFTAAVLTAAVLIAVVAGTWSHGAHAATKSDPPCHEMATAATAPNCATLCEVSSLSDVAVKQKGTDTGFAGLRAVAVEMPPNAFIAAVHPRDRHWRPPGPHPLAINHRRLI